MTTWYPMTWSTAHHWGHVPTLASVVKKTTFGPQNHETCFFSTPQKYGLQLPPQKNKECRYILMVFGDTKHPLKISGIPKKPGHQSFPGFPLGFPWALLRWRTRRSERCRSHWSPHFRCPATRHKNSGEVDVRTQIEPLEFWLEKGLAWENWPAKIEISLDLWTTWSIKQVAHHQTTLPWIFNLRSQ